MTKPKVLITHCVHDAVVERLSETCEIVANTTRSTWPRERVLALARDCHAIMVFMPDSIDAAFVEKCARLKIVAAALKGFDNFDVGACTRRGVWFTRVPDLLTVPTAELAIGLLLAITRRMLPGDDHVRSGFSGWRPMLYGTGLWRRTAGIIGLGAVGRALVERLSAFGVRFVYTDPAPAPAEFAAHYALERVDLDALLARSDFVFPLVHLTPDTRHLIGGEALAKMKRGVYLVNVGRGSVVDENAVAQALDSHHLGGYAADVFELEDWALTDRPHVVSSALVNRRARTFFTPHLGSAVDEVRLSIEMEAAENILEVLRGERPHGAVNEPRIVGAR